MRCGENICGSLPCEACVDRSTCTSDWRCDKAGPCKGLSAEGCCLNDTTRVVCNRDYDTGVYMLEAIPCMVEKHCGWNSELEYGCQYSAPQVEPTGLYPRMCSEYGISL